MTNDFPQIEILKELIKSYYIAQIYDTNKAADLLSQINDLRLAIALDAEAREIFYGQLKVPQSVAYSQTQWFSRFDIAYILKRGIGFLEQGVTLSTVNQGNKQRIITREPIAWQQMFSDIQGDTVGQQSTFDFPQELIFGENEALGLNIAGQSDNDGYLWFHGCTLKDRNDLSDALKDDLANEIAGYMPEPQLVPLIFAFANNTLGTAATNPAGGPDILSAKNEHNVILTHVSCNFPVKQGGGHIVGAQITLQDVGRNQLIADNISSEGFVANFDDPYTGFYPLPFPHLLRKGDRLKMKATNGIISQSANQTVAAGTYYLTFAGYTL